MLIPRLLLLCLTMTAGCIVLRPSSGKTAAAVQEAPEPDLRSTFIKVEGTHFTAKGKPFRFHGTNFYRLGLKDEGFTDLELEDIFTKLDRSGQRVLRMWGFSCQTPAAWTEQALQNSGSGSVHPNILDQAGVPSETALTYLDKVMARASAHGMKVILPLVNFEPQFCGMAWWTKVYGNPGESRQAFYCNERVIAAYKGYVAALLNRVNTVTGVAYKNDPTILSIEVANEPHTTDHYEDGKAIDASCKPFVDGKAGTLVYRWLGEITTFVRSIDANHMISTGEEGYRTHGGDGRMNQWIFDGSKGVDFDRNITLPNVSFATAHLYPDNWNVPAQDFNSWFVPQVIKGLADVAHSAGKPIIVEESGFSRIDRNDQSDFMNKIRASGYGGDRAKWLSEVYKAANDAGYAGTMIWQATPNRDDGSAYEEDDYSFSFRDPAMAAIEAQVRAMGAGSTP